MTMNENKDVNIDKDESIGQDLTAYSIREGLKYATSLEQSFLAHDPAKDRVLQLQNKLESCAAGYQELTKQLEKQKKCTLEQNPTVVFDRSSGDSAIFKPVHNKLQKLFFNEEHFSFNLKSELDFRGFLKNYASE